MTEEKDKQVEQTSCQKSYIPEDNGVKALKY